MVESATIIPEPLPAHVSLVKSKQDWMRRRVTAARIPGLFVFDMKTDGGTMTFHPRRDLPVSRLMALDLPKEVATSIRHKLETYNELASLLGPVVDRSDRPLKFSLVKLNV